MSRVAFLLIVVCAYACTPDGPGAPPEEIEELAPLLAELQLAESLVAEIPHLVTDSMRRVYYLKTLEENGYTEAEFDSLLWIIRQEPVWVDSLYTRAGEELQRLSLEK